MVLFCVADGVWSTAARRAMYLYKGSLYHFMDWHNNTDAHAHYRAAEMMTQTGQRVTLKVAKQGAIYHGLATVLSQQSPIMQRGGCASAMRLGGEGCGNDVLSGADTIRSHLLID